MTSTTTIFATRRVPAKVAIVGMIATPFALKPPVAVLAENDALVAAVTPLLPTGTAPDEVGIPPEECCDGLFGLICDDGGGGARPLTLPLFAPSARDGLEREWAVIAVGVKEFWMTVVDSCEPLPLPFDRECVEGIPRALLPDDSLINC